MGYDLKVIHQFQPEPVSHEQSAPHLLQKLQNFAVQKQRLSKPFLQKSDFQQTEIPSQLVF